jgi:hypothetical protein
LFAGKAVAHGDGVYDAGFGEGAGLGHDTSLLSVGGFMLQVKGLICQLNLSGLRIFPEGL